MFKNIINTIEKSENILIFTHINPDGDAIGSCYALKKALEIVGKNSSIILEKPLPEIFLMYKDSFCLKENINIDDFDLKISLDCGDLNRLGEVKDLFFGNTINIDHHFTNSNFADINYIDSNSAATGEIIFDLLKEMNIIINKEISDGLYISILTDTGGFMFSNTTPKTHIIASELIKNGCDFYYLNKKMMQDKSYSKHLIYAKSIELMEFYYNNKICICELKHDLCEEFNITSDDINGLSSLPRSVIGVEVGVLITEIQKGEIKVSLRSDSLIDVSEIAKKFGGGGHKRASGFCINGEIEKIKESLLNETINTFKRLDLND